jgi:C-5 cytosine-specific DNA methylase
MKRVWAGFKKFALAEIPKHHNNAVFIAPSDGPAQPLDKPMASVNAENGAEAGCVIESRIKEVSKDEAFFLSRYGHDVDRTRPLSEPIPTITGSGAGYLIEPSVTAAPSNNGQKPLNNNLIVRYHGQSKAKSVEQPLSTIEAGAVKHHVATTRLRAANLQADAGKDQDSAYLVKLKGTGVANDPREPLHTVTGGGLHHALVEPSVKAAMILPQHGGGEMRHESEPVPTVASKGAIRLLEASAREEKGFVVELGHGEKKSDQETGRTHSLEKPIGTITGSNNFYLAEGTLNEADESFLLQVNHADTPGSNGSHRIRSLEDPLPTVCGNRGEWAIADATVRSPVQLKETAPSTPPAANDLAYIIKYFRTGIAKPTTEPLDTVTSKHRFGLVLPELIEFDPETEGLPKEGKVYIQIDQKFYELDLKLRMLEPHELALAQGFRSDYRFEGTKTSVVKQIGNAVPRRLARSIVAAALTQNPDAPEILLERDEAQNQTSRHPIETAA